MKQKICILGATGSIGSSTLAVMAANTESFELVSVSAYSSVEKMLKICQKFNPKTAVMVDEKSAEALQKAIQKNNLDTVVLSGEMALVEIASSAGVDQVMAAIVGAAGLKATLAAVQADKKVLLANKESLVMMGQLFMDELANSKAILMPVDSEHNAIFQCMPKGYEIGQIPQGVRKILLTGSGGPFRTTPIKELSDKTPEQAVLHPNWSMGAKISVDSATMMNKGLELIEAKWLFAVEDDALEIVVHPQSVIHSMVEYVDGSVLAQMGQPDMKTPIAHCMAGGGRINSGASALDFMKVAELTFESPNEERFPALRLTKEAWAQGGDAMAVLNAANEVAVAAFLNKQIKFTQITDCIERALAEISGGTGSSLEDVLLTDKETRAFVLRFVES